MKNPIVHLITNDYSPEFQQHLFEVTRMPLKLYHRAYWVIGINAAFFFFSMWSRPMLWSALALSVVLFVQYFRLKKIASGLSITRKISQFRNEQGGQFKITYRLENNSTQNCPPLFVTDHTMYLAMVPQVLTCAEGLESRQKIDLTTIAHVESPAGRTTMGPFAIRVRDELGLFEAIEYGDNDEAIEVYHGRREFEKNQLLRPNDSPMPGDLEVSTKGQGVNIIGVREYEDGDPLNHISWKRSTQDDELFVKELERDISRRVVIVLDLPAVHQIGYGASNTAEVAKSLANQLIVSYLKAQSSVSLFTSNIQVKDISGAQNVGFAKKIIAEFDPAAEQSGFALSRVAQLITAPCLVLLVTTFAQERSDDLLTTLLHLKSERFEPHVYFIDPNFSAQMVNKKFGSFIEKYKKTEFNRKAIEKRFHAAGISVSWTQATHLSGQISTQSSRAASAVKRHA